MTGRAWSRSIPGQRSVRPPLGAVADDAYHDWDEIYLDNVVRVYRLLYAKVGNRADTEDLTTEVFLAAYRPLRINASRARSAPTSSPPPGPSWPRSGGRDYGCR